MNLGIRDFQAKSGRDSGLKVSQEVGCQKGKHRDCTNFGVGVTGLKNPIGDPSGRYWVQFLALFISLGISYHLRRTIRRIN